MRWRDILLGTPAVFLAIGLAVELAVPPPWDELSMFVVWPFSAAAIGAYLLLGRRERRADRASSR